jgi:hypothetical protein
MKHKSAVMGEMIVFSICNKPFKLLGILRVKFREGLTLIIPINIFNTMSFTSMNFHTNTWFLLMSMFNKIKHQNHTIRASKMTLVINVLLRQYMLQKMQSEINTES